MHIDRVIHYCWFGKTPKPDSVLTYIANWREMLPTYQIIEWNEDNFDIDCCQYVKEAYAAKKYAFVSDYARLLALYQHGGVYLDTDVEVCKNLDPLLARGVLTFGFEEGHYAATSTMIAPKASTFIADFMDSYHARHFIDSNGKLDTTTNVQVLTALLEAIGLAKNGVEQVLHYQDEEIAVLPQRFLSPFDYLNHQDKSGDQTYTIHHFSNSWASVSSLRKNKIKKLIGSRGVRVLRKILSTRFNINSV